MKVNDEIQPLVSDFERIKQVADNGSAFWSARDLCTAMGYSTYQKFERILKKAQETASAKGLGEANHFNQTVEMVRLGSGSFRKVENCHLSREACLLVAEKADRKKPQVQMALRYFSQNDSAVETVQNSEISSILLYKTSQGESRIEVIFNSDTFWMPQKRMAELYGVDVRTISYHLGEIFQSGELAEKSVLRKIGITAADGKVYDTNVYNLDAIIAVGYRVNSYQATQFRIWATQVLKEYIIKGFTLDDERLKNLGGGNYWQELMARIRDIRASEKVFYRQVLDIYATSIDYDPHADTSIMFFKKVQNKMHFAVHGQTAAEVIYSRADAEKAFMGLTTFSGDKPSLQDALIAKNYLDERELRAMGQIVSGYLDFAERKAERHEPMTMSDWSKHLDQILTAGGEKLLQGNGSISHEQAVDKATGEYRKYQQKTLSSVEKAFLDSIKSIEKKVEKN